MVLEARTKDNFVTVSFSLLQILDFQRTRVLAQKLKLILNLKIAVQAHLHSK